MSYPVHPSRDSRRAEPRRSLNGSLPSGRPSLGERSRERVRSGERAPINRPRDAPFRGKGPAFRDPPTRGRSPPIRPRDGPIRPRDNKSRSTDNLSCSYETGRPSRPSSDIRPASAAARPRPRRSSPPLNRSAEGARSRDNPARAHRRSNELSEPRDRQEERPDQGFSLKVRIVTNEKTEEKRVPGVSIKSRLGKREVVKVPDPTPRRRAISSNLPPARPLRAARPRPIPTALRTAPARRALRAAPIRTPIRTALRRVAARATAGAAPLRPVPTRDTIKRAERSSPARVSKYNQDLLKDKLRKLKSLKIKRQFLEKTKTTAYRDLRELRKNEIAQELARKRKEKKSVSSAATKRSPSVSTKRSPGIKRSPRVPSSTVRRRKVSSGRSSQTDQPSVRRRKLSSSQPEPPKSNIKQVHHLNNFNITKHYPQEEGARSKDVFVTKDSYYHCEESETRRRTTERRSSPKAVPRRRKSESMNTKRRQSAQEIRDNGRPAEARRERPRRSREEPSKTKVTNSVRRHCSEAGRSSHRLSQAVNRKHTPPSKSSSSKKRSPREKNDDIKRHKLSRDSEVYHFGSDISEDEASNLVVKEEAVSSSSSSSGSSSSSDSESSPAPSPIPTKQRQPRHISNSKWCSDSDNDAVSIHASPRVHHLPNFDHKVISRYENSHGSGTRGNSPERMFRQRMCPLCHLDLKTMDDVKRHVMSQRHQIITGEFFHTRPELLRPAGRNDEVICTICNSVISRSVSQHERQGLHKEMMARWTQRKQPVPPYPYYLHKGTPKKEKK